ncbi:hypothetical protein [Oryzomonas rubra]|uniref:Uncharacterized protein n=1 Tax=Oryzomonas rubra TaxID=2509454 RepID=A0A5A9XEX3_9BACT|nr:hypothetical protein [Oryzomonas rubra]KAA0891707.1 hypothetical protein ET418_09690 [Oryzomonas rubra]
MKCPICSSYDYSAIDLQTDGFAEQIMECRSCGTVWSINHGAVEIVKDPHRKSFLQAQSECVEGDDTNSSGL